MLGEDSLSLLTRILGVAGGGACGVVCAAEGYGQKIGWPMGGIWVGAGAKACGNCTLFVRRADGRADGYSEGKTDAFLLINHQAMCLGSTVRPMLMLIERHVAHSTILVWFGDGSAAKSVSSAECTLGVMDGYTIILRDERRSVNLIR